MPESFTVTQKQRLTELNAGPAVLEQTFGDAKARDVFFKQTEKELARQNKAKLLRLVNEERLPLSCRVEAALSNWLTEREGYTRVVTPIIISEAMLNKMTITPDHPLTNQVFWLEGKKCLRPMLAPNLYTVMGDMLKVLRQPVKIFECGPCFRKETQGAQHMNEFTMLNMVELASIKDGEQMGRLKAVAMGAMEAIGLTDYELVVEHSEVYGETLDIVSNGVELASGAYGPHPLDGQWGIFDTWVGLGFGIERIALVMGGYQNIKRVGRSTSYVDGNRLNI